MDDLNLSTAFLRMGARVASIRDVNPSTIRVDVRRDRRGEYFDILAGAQVRISSGRSA